MKISTIKAHSAIYDVLTDDSVVVDLGASEGVFSKQLKEKVNCVLHQVEANPELFKQLNKLDKTVSYNLAISNANSEATFYLSDNPSSSSLRHDKRINFINEISIKCQSLKTFVDENNIHNIDLLKMDIEGAEIDVLMSIDEILIDRISQMTVEFHEKQFITENEICRIKSVINKMRRYGMYCINFTKPRYTDVLFINLNHISLNIVKQLILILFFEIIVGSYRNAIIIYNRLKSRVFKKLDSILSHN